MAKVENIDEYINLHSKWKPQLLEFQKMLKQTELQPSIKWDRPVYSLDNKNLVGFAAFKNHVALWFFHGSLLKKNTRLLINAQEGKTKAQRQIRFDKTSEIDGKELLPYIQEAIQLHKEGKSINPVTAKKLVMPAELSEILDENNDLKSAFKNLSPGRQREYSDYISEAKQETTRQKRLEKIIPLILKGVGLNDKYKNC